ncbi:MAG TPA: isoprenyl transferase [Firmicutes bacterium]|nr:isoprenyl transferase [Bacillota bacterium]
MGREPQKIQGVPRHIGIIMDGNGRWAKQRGLPRTAGHKVGADTFQKITNYCAKIGVEVLTVYAFSTENWARPKEEVDTIMDLLRSYLKNSFKQTRKDIIVRFIGDRAPLAEDIRRMMADAEARTRDSKGMILNVAVNYGGRAEIVMAARELAQQAVNGELSPESITEELFSGELYTAGQPDPDLIIRPSGEHRISNFLTWQCAYSEFVDMNVLWPDFKEKHLDAAIEEFKSRDRRFGGI